MIEDEIRQLFRTRRLELDLTYDRLSEISGVEKLSILRFEHGKTSLNLRSFVWVSQALRFLPEDVTPKTFAENLLCKRKKLKVSQDHIGIKSNSDISRIERCHKVPNLNSAIDISNVLNASIWEMFE